MTDFVMPSLGADMESGTLVEWHVKPGDTVKRGDVVASVETSKGIIDIEIFAEGVIESLLVEPGSEVPVGASLARYHAVGAAPSAPAAPPAPGTPRRLASPAARKRAAELGVDIETVTPQSGSAVTLQDIERAAAAKSPPSVKPAAPLTDMRAVIGQSMSRSKREIPHYYLATTIDLRKALAWLGQYNAARSVTQRLLPGILLIKAVARTIERFPELNGFWRDNRFETSAIINVGTAIARRQGGLIAPALLAANEQPLADLMRAFQDLVQRARSKGLRSTELSGATITVSSLGEGGVETVYPIIHPPQVAIVGFGGIVTRPWCDGDTIVSAPVITATLAADHRVSDGQRGSAFLNALASLLQRPETL